MTRRSFASVVLIVGIVCPAVALTQPVLTSEQRAQVMRHYDSATRAQRENRNLDAAHEFDAAFQISRRIEFLYNAAREYERVGANETVLRQERLTSLQTSRTRYAQFMTNPSAGASSMRSEVQTAITRVSGMINALTPAQTIVPQTVPQVTNPNTLTLAVQPPIRQARSSVTPPHPPVVQPRRFRFIPYQLGLLSLGVATLGFSLWSELDSMSARSAVENASQWSGDSERLQGRATNAHTGALISLGIGSALVLAGGIWLAVDMLRRPSTVRRETLVLATPTLDGTGAMLGLSRAF